LWRFGLNAWGFYLHSLTSCEADYSAGLFGREDFARLLQILGGIQGRFLLSLNDRPEVRALFAGFKIEAVETTWTIAGHKRVREVLIGN
jgi:DNA adenine methylase